MKNKKLVRLCGVTLALVLSMATLAGCGDKKGNGQETQVSAQTSQESVQGKGSEADRDAGGNTEETSGSSQSAESDAKGSEESTEGIQPGENGFYQVSSVEELLEAIRPGAGITIAPGKYNLTDFLGTLSDDQITKWNNDHPYVQIYQVFDGLEIWVHSVPDLYIEGGSKNTADTEIVTEPRYACLLTFCNCPNLELQYLTMGHTDRGNCSGDVLDFNSCRDVKLTSMDLYGCGVYGIGAVNRCGDFLVKDSVIRDCEYGPLTMEGCKGAIVFENCSLTGSLGGGFFEYREDASLTFKKCSFGENETNSWYFDEYATFEDCEWSEITMYPDYEYPDIEG